MMKLSVLFFLSGSAAAHFHDGPPPPPPPPPMSPMHKLALQKMEEVCQTDAEIFCRPPRETREDPVLNWLFSPPERLAPPPIVHPAAIGNPMHPMDPLHPMNLGPLLDSMMDTAIRLPTLVQPEEPVFIMFIDDSNAGNEERPEDLALESMITKLIQHDNHVNNMINSMVHLTLEAPEAEQQEQPEVHDLTHHIRLKGQSVLEQAEQEPVPEDRVRMARRLTEVTPEEMMARIMQGRTVPAAQPTHDERKSHMCPHKHKCLMTAHEQNKVTPACGDALVRLERVRTLEMKQHEEMYLYMNFFWLYSILFFSLFVMILFRKFKSGKGLFLLRLRVLQAVYSNPEIKAKVEDEVGAPLGSVPPLNDVALKLLSTDGRKQCRRKRERFFWMLNLLLVFFTLDAFGLLPEEWPLFVMGGCCLFMACRIVTMCCSKPEVRECKCCCCGGSTLDIENGTVSNAQACCKCCKGSGVCAVKCQTCCGTADNKKSGTGSCCGGKCKCAKDHGCNGSCGCCGGKDLEAALYVKLEDDCKCCCCGGSNMDVVNGTMSDAQACCTCCKGTGKCSAKCKTCCGNGGKKDGAGSCCGGKCKCAKDHGCNGSCDCCGGKDMEAALFGKLGDDCKCCCCGGSNVDVVNGTMSAAQACCTCCKGTGKCSAKCKTCCGNGGKKDGAGSCCGGKCKCAKDHGCNGSCDCCGHKKETGDAEIVVFQGIPIQIV
ncbi:expressed unknown protein [Seminavis robusta]|uniref:Uncharacterized protein n=1 Tax=Seminavis robusta TaxID=568900 RepID=A0A9N8HEF6_9STRA|nr:expressed unknown protein [Seminavis robusta]|eukprot:Sro301_g112030.1 n/a (713) ;mRNA; r:57427-59746